MTVINIILCLMGSNKTILNLNLNLWFGISLKFVLYGTTDNNTALVRHDDVIKWKHFPRYWPFVRGIHRFPVNFPHKGQWRGALMFSLICVWINGWVNNHEAGDLRRYRAHYDVTVMGNGFPSNRRQAVIWTSADPVNRFLYHKLYKSTNSTDNIRITDALH